MAFRNISVVITANASQLVGAYGQAAAATDAFAASMAASTAEMAALEAATTAGAARLGALTAASAESRVGLGALGLTALDTAAALDVLGAASVAAGATGALAGFQAATAEITAMATAAGVASRELTVLAASSAAAGAAGAAGGAQQAAGAAAAGAGAQRMAGQAAQAERLVGQLAGSAGVAGAQLGTLGASATTAAAGAQRAGASMQLAGQVGAAALAVGLVAAVAGAVQFDAAMHNVASIDSQVRSNFASTEQQILSLSKTVPQSAQTLVQGLYNISSSGIYGASAMGVLGVSAKAASAGLTDANTASKAIVASLNAYGMVVTDAGSETANAAATMANATRVSDALFSTVNYGVISFEALTAAVANTVGNAARAGVGIEQVGTALATMTLSGMSASNAGVSLNNLLSKLVKPSAALQQEFGKLGITQADLSDTGIGLHGVMEKLRTSGDANVKTLLQWFPEIRAARGAMALMAGDGEAYARVFGEMGDATKTAGSSQVVFAEQMKSTKAQLSIFKNEIAATGIEIGAALLPYLNQGISGLASFGGAVKDVGGQLLSGVSPGVRDLVQALGDLAQIAQNLHLDDLALGLAKLGVGAVVVSFDALAAAVAATTGFFRDHQAAAAGLAAALLLLNLGTITAGFVSMGAAIGRVGFSAFLWAVGAAQPLIQAFSTNLAGTLVTMGAYAAAIAAVVVVQEAWSHGAGQAKAAITDLTSGIDVNNVQQLGTAIEELTKKRDALADSWKLKGNPLGDIFFPGDSAKVEEYGKAIDDLTAKQTAITANSQTLATQYGMTAEAARNLATAHKIDLSQSLDAVNASGLTAQAQFAAVAVQLTMIQQTATATGQPLMSTAQAMNLLNFDASAAKATLDGLNDTFDRLSGRAISSVTALNNWSISLMNLASGTSLATDAAGRHTASLDSNTVAGLSNQNMLLALLTQNQATAQAVYNSMVVTQGKDAAEAAYNQTLADGETKLRAAALASGVTAAEFDKLMASANTASTAAGGLSTSIAGVGASAHASAADVGALNAQLAALDGKSVSAQITVYATTVGNINKMAAYDAQGKAAGGRVVGPGGPTDDRVPIMASAGEWVIRASAASSYGPHAMAAVNAGVATIGYATGGEVGRGPVFPRFAGGGMVSGGGGGVVVNNTTYVSVTGGMTNEQTGRIVADAVDRKIDQKFAKVVHAVRAGAGRGRG